MAHYVSLIDGMSNATEADFQGFMHDFLLQEGVLDKSGGHYQVTEKGTPDMSVDVATGIAYVENDSWSEFSSDEKFWRTILDASVNKSISSNSSGSTRNDIICIKIDTGASPDSNASNVASVVVVDGTPGSGVPSTPANHLKIAEVEVVDGATSITNSDITDTRQEIGLTADLLKVITRLNLDTIEENTADNGVSIDGLTIKDGVARHGASAIQTTVKARAYLDSSTQTIPNSTATKVQLGTESFDPGGNFDNSTNYRFVAPVAGDYLVICKAQWADVTDNTAYRSLIYKNGSLFNQTTNSSGNSATDTLAVDLVPLAANDYVEFYVQQFAGSDQDIAGGQQHETYMAVSIDSTN